MRKHLSTILLLFMFAVGLSILLYPTVSDYWNSKTQTRVIQSYDELIQNFQEEDFSAYFDEAGAYNEALRTLTYPLMNAPKQLPQYWNLLDLGNNGIMGYIGIPKINVTLPVYHGTSRDVLNVACGHIEGTSLPIGGESTHSVLSAHRGLPSAKLFTNLDKLEVGDIFILTVLKEQLTYEVDQILIVEPEDVEPLAIEEGQDYCTLVTCTPYGINTHRLLVRGIRIENAVKKSPIFLKNDAYRIDPLYVTPVVAAPMLLVLLVILLVKYRKKRG